MNGRFRRMLRGRMKLSFAIAAAALLAVSLGLVIFAGGAAGEPSDEDMKAVSRLITEAQGIKHVAWPQSQLASETLSSSTDEALETSQRSVLQDIGTAEFAEEAYFNWAGFLQESRDADGIITVENEFKVMSVEVTGTDKDGNLVVRAMVWSGETRGSWSDEEAQLVSVSTVDCTPVWEYTVCLQDGEWRLMRERLVELSEDASLKEYGPDTPHEQASAGD